MLIATAIVFVFCLVKKSSASFLFSADNGFGTLFYLLIGRIHQKQNSLVLLFLVTGHLFLSLLVEENVHHNSYIITFMLGLAMFLYPSSLLELFGIFSKYKA